MPLDPMVYADMLGERDCQGQDPRLPGQHRLGSRAPTAWGTASRSSYNRINVNAALDGTLEEAEFIHDDVFNLDIPTSCPGVPDEVMVPWKCWSSKEEYDATAKKLAAMYQENFGRSTPTCPEREKRRPARLAPA